MRITPPNTFGLTDLNGKMLELVEGEKLGGSVVRRMNNGMYLINLKGREVTAKLDAELGDSTRFRAQVVSTGSGNVELKVVKNFEDGFNTAVVRNATAGEQQSSSTQAKIFTDEAASKLAKHSLNPNDISKGDIQTKLQPQVQQQTQQQAQSPQNSGDVVLRLLKGTIPNVKTGEVITIDIVRTLSNGVKLLDANGYLFKADLGETVLNSLKVEILRTDPALELLLLKNPIENLDALKVKTEIGKFDFATLLRSVGKFSSINLSNVTAEELKASLKESGIFFENKLASGDQVSSDEKFRAYVDRDVSAREAITRLQLVNVLMNDGLTGYFKTQNEDVGDALFRYKNDGKGSGVMYLSLEFSKIGKTFATIRQVKDVFDIVIKSEKDISEMLKEVEIENAFIRWLPYEVKDETVFEVKKDTAAQLGGFDTTA
jgi:hypothetical protein